MCAGDYRDSAGELHGRLGLAKVFLPGTSGVHPLEYLSATVYFPDDQGEVGGLCQCDLEPHGSDAQPLQAS